MTRCRRCVPTSRSSSRPASSGPRSAAGEPMSYAPSSLPRGYRYPQEAGWFSFAGGLNNRDDASELGPADVIQAYNVTFDERGGVSSRLGYSVVLNQYNS